MEYLELANDLLSVKADPACGGRIVSFYDKEHAREYIWYDEKRLPADPLLDYDGNFAGGMDELLPCDLAEHGFPDHGELWQLPLKGEILDGKMVLKGDLPLSKLSYSR